MAYSTPKGGKKKGCSTETTHASRTKKHSKGGGGKISKTTTAARHIKY